MAMNSSGPISLGGATTGESINLEIGSPATSTVSLNDTIVRTLAGVVSGTIVVPTDFYGKSLSNSFFQVFTNTSGRTANFMDFDPAGNYYIRGDLIDIFCNSSGTITSSKIYTAVTAPAPTANYYSGRRTSYISKVNPSNLITGGSAIVTNSIPVNNTRNRGAIGVFNYPTDTFTSKITRNTWTTPAPNPSPASMSFLAARDFPNGNIVASVGSTGPTGRYCGLATFDQSLNLLSYVGEPFAANLSNNSGTFFDASPTVVSCYFNAYGSTSRRGFSVYLDATTGAINSVRSVGSQPVGPGTTQFLAETVGPTVNMIYYGGASSTSYIGQYNNSSLTYNYQKQWPTAIPNIHGLSRNFTSTGSALAGANVTTAPTTRPCYLINIDNTVTITNRWTVSLNGVTNDIVFGIHKQVRDGKYYILGSYSGFIYLLVIPEDLSTIASGLTATAAGLTLTLTPSGDPGPLNFTPSSMSMAGTSFAGASFVESGNPNPFTYTTDAVTSTKVSI